MIREATIDDIEKLIILGWKMHQESRWQIMNYSHEKVAEFFINCIESDAYLVIVSEVNSEVVGGFIGYAMPHWFSNDVMAGDFAVFLAKEHRGGLVASQLIKQFKLWAKEKSATIIQLGISSGLNVDKTGQLYERLGFEKFGLMFDLRSD